MKRIIMALVAMNLVGCATSLPRTKWNDAQHRVFIDPENINTADYARIQHALVNTGKFVVVDRAQALRAVKREQERLHREEKGRNLSGSGLFSILF